MKFLWFAGPLVGALLAPTALAQTRLRVAVPQGEVTGVELGVEGGLEGTEGATLHWFARIYEVLGHRDLRPAEGCRVRAHFTGDDAIVETTSGPRGVTPLDLTIPRAPAPADSIHVEAECRSVRRVFDVPFSRTGRTQLRLAVRSSGDQPALVAVRVFDALEGRGVEGARVRLRVAAGERTLEDRWVRTDGGGMAAILVPVDAPGVAQVQVRASTRIAGESAYAESAASVLRDSARAAVGVQPVEVSAHPRVVRAGESTELQVVVRDERGRPRRGVEVAPLDDEEFARAVRTDDDGRARVRWLAPRGGAAFQDVEATVRLRGAAIPYTSGSTSVRVVSRELFVQLETRRRAVTPGLPAEFGVRAVDGAGEPLRDAVLTIDGGLVTPVTVQTDARGEARFEATFRASLPEDDCGGATATELRVSYGRDTQRVCVPVDLDALVDVHAPLRAHPGEAVPLRLTRRGFAVGKPLTLTLLVARGEGFVPVREVVVPEASTAINLDVPNDLEGSMWIRARVPRPDGSAVRAGGTLVRVSRSRESAHPGGAPSSPSVVAFGRDTGWLDVLDPEHCGVRGSDASCLEVLASHMPSDLTASYAAVGDTVVIQPLPESPQSEGLLRDPWRLRARLLRGRIGSLLLAIERFVDSAIPDSIDEVAYQDGSGWHWNREVLRSALRQAGVDEEVAVGLDGQPLDLDALLAFDPQFTFDRVAARLTRRRLFSALVAMREMVDEQDLDVGWATRGDPSRWLLALAERVDESALYDGWGRPFVVRQTTRQPMLPLLAGWELASMGADGVDGSGDDLYDPRARVLPVGSLYANAVEEDVLVARLQRIVLSRASLSALFNVLDVSAVEMPEPESESDEVVAIVPEVMPPRFARAEEPSLGGARLVAANEGWTAPEAALTYLVVTGRDGGLVLEHGSLRPGAQPVEATLAPDLPEVRLPMWLHPGDDLTVPLPASLEGARVESTDRSVEVAIVGGQVRLRAGAVGRADVTLSLGERVVAERRVRVLPRGSLFVVEPSLWCERDTTLAVSSDGTPTVGTVVVSTPEALPQSPILDLVGPDATASRAWAAARHGRSYPIGPDSARDRLDEVLLAVARAATGESAALRGARPALSELPPEERGAFLLAVAHLVPEGTSNDPWVDDLRADAIREGVRRYARMTSTARDDAALAAGLLAIDPRSSIARRLLGRARATAPSGESAEAWTTTMVLALAEHLAGEPGGAERARRAMEGLRHLRTAGREAAFWLLANSVYGSLGVSSPTASPAVSGVPGQSFDARQPRAVPLGDATELRVTTTSPLLVFATRRALEVVERHEDGLALHWEGIAAPRLEVDGAPVRSFFELVLESQRVIGSFGVEVHLPSVYGADTATLSTLQGLPGIESVEGVDRAGVLRFRMAGALPGARVRIPLSFVRLANGRARGLAVVLVEGDRVVGAAPPVEVRDEGGSQ